MTKNKKENMKRQLIRQGDVLLIPVDEKPARMPVKHAKLTLQLGEATGHHHTLYPIQGEGMAPVAESFEQNGRRFVRLDAVWLLKHQEHKEFKVPAGTYEIRIEQEEDPFEEEMKKVVD
jgi:hypothetical protein